MRDTEGHFARPSGTRLLGSLWDSLDRPVIVTDFYRHPGRSMEVSYYNTQNLLIHDECRVTSKSQFQSCLSGDENVPVAVVFGPRVDGRTHGRREKRHIRV